MESEVTKLILKDYSSAVIHVLGLHKSKKEQQLLFAQVECLPCGVSSLSETPVDGYTFKYRSGERLYYYRLVVPIEKAIKWYLGVSKINKINLKDLSDDFNRTPFAFGELETPISWNELPATDELAFVANRWGVVRSHHFVQKKISGVVSDFFENEKEKAVPWCNSTLGWNISDYDVFWGSINLILPNPFYLSCRGRLHISPKGEESIYYTVKSLRDDYPKSLEMLHVEWHWLGLYKLNKQKMTSTMKFKHSTTNIDKVAYIVVCQKRGIIDFKNFTGFIRQMNLSIGVETSEKNMFTKNNDFFEKIRKRIDYSESTLGKSSTTKLLSFKKQTEPASKQFWLDDKTTAQQILSSLIQGARSRIIIVDPYFAVPEIFEYLTEITSEKIKTTVLTSSKALKFKREQENMDKTFFEQSGTDEDCKIALQALKDKWGKIDFYVMGNTPLIHDRFLVIDNKVWFSGNSLNNIGVQASLLIEVYDSHGIIKKIEEAMTSIHVNKLDDLLKNK